MSAIQAIHENGVFRPLGPVDLPEPCEVEVVPKRQQEPVSEIDFSDEARAARNMDAVYEILLHRHRSGRSDLSERHNEHQRVTTAFLDSVGLLATWDEDDLWHEQATAAYAQLSREKAVLYSTTFVLAECGNTAARYSHRLEPDLLRARLTKTGTLIFPTADGWDTVWTAYRRSEAGGAGIVDQISFAVMRRLGVTRAFTNDRHFRAAG